MVKIFDEPSLMRKVKPLRIKYEELKNQENFLDGFYPTLKAVEEWKYSAGTIFDQPPYGAEMAGFDPGRLLNKRYANPFEARVKGAYSSGFVSGKHVVTVSPVKPENVPLEASFYLHEDEVVRRYSLTIYNADFSAIEKPTELRGLSESYFLRDKVFAYVGVGSRKACAIYLYYINELNSITKASMVTGPYDSQDDFDFVYEGDELVRVLSNGVIWEGKSK